ncbi:hypothetical protein SNE40_022427 [Patella caerulea]|uniref:Uncharacterized protein n=1 Tax=Patella caerulea TaxID=87958 RepID=A0AAN8IV00_PATCE
MHLPGKVTYFILLSLTCSSIAFGIHMIGLSTPYWRLVSVQGQEVIRSGLWKTCFVSTRLLEDFACRDISEKYMDSSFKAVESCALISLLLILVGGVSTTAALALARENLSHTNWLRFSTVINFLAVISSLVAIVMYGVITNRYKEEREEFTRETVIFGWSFILEIITTVLVFLAAIMSLVHIRTKNECLPTLSYETEIDAV